jgi:transcriptional regulator with XRE-family HTH domain
MAATLNLEATADAGAILGADVCAVVGAMVRRAREARCWSQRELARRCGYDRAAVARLERGEASSLAVVTTQLQAVGLAARFYLSIEPLGS